MKTQVVVDLLSNMLWSTFWISLPLLMVGLVAGVVISFIQIITSIQDPSFSAVPRLFAVFAALVLLLPWILFRLTDYTSQLLRDVARYGN